MDSKEKIEKIILNRKKAHSKLIKKNSNVYKKFLDMEKETFTNKSLKKYQKELIAIGISIVINCESCMEWHIKQALETGASESQIIEAIEVGIEMGGGPATVSSRFALDVLDYYKNLFEINEIKENSELEKSISIIRESFITVANDLNLNPGNCPTNPAFITVEKIMEMQSRNIKMFGLFKENIQIGFVAIESADPKTFYLEKLAVLPEYRHYGYGKKLLDFVFNYVKNKNGSIISIGIINDNNILKDWYLSNGFTEKSTKEIKHLPFTVCFMEKEIT